MTPDTAALRSRPEHFTSHGLFVHITAAERDALCDAADSHAALVADLRALHKPGFPDREGKAECKECFDTWPCRTVAALDRHAPEEGS